MASLASGLTTARQAARSSWSTVSTKVQMVEAQPDASKGEMHVLIQLCRLHILRQAEQGRRLAAKRLCTVIASHEEDTIRRPSCCR
jgi:hypothetical protein